ncbi:MAG: LamG-like jellyroll fold domain-containing protein [Verrucomicrobiota bacterium]|jgi:hypothetical protein
MQRYKLMQKELGLMAALGLCGALCVSAQSLAHRYSFNDPAGSSTFADSVGGADGTLNNATAGNPNSASLDGSQLQLDGTGGYGVMPGGLVSTNMQVTVEFWASFSETNEVWTRTFVFGDQINGAADTTLDYCHYAGGNYQNLNFATAAGSGYANNPSGLNGVTNVHVTAVVDPVNNKMYYYNGTTLMSTPNFTTLPPLSSLMDSLALLGRSLYDGDPALSGSINEFRIYSGVLTPSAIAVNDAAGPDNYVTSAGALQTVHLYTPSSTLLLAGNLQVNFLGDFANVTNVNLIAYGGASFASGNTAVLTVNPTNGIVHAVGVGTTSVTGTFASQNASATITVVSVPAVLAHRYSFTSDASDSVGGANGTLNGDAAISGGQVVLDGTTGTYVGFPGAQINIATNAAISVEIWATYGGGSTWSRLWEFGSGVNNNNNLYSAPQVPNGEIFTAWPVSENIGNGSQTFALGLNPLTNLTQHSTVVINPTSSYMAVYTNGVLEYSANNVTASLANCSTGLVSLGFSSAGDPPWIGSINEFRLYAGALSGPEVALTDRNGPNSTNRSPGALQSIQVVAQSYPAYASLVAPTILANYANLTGFNLLPNITASVFGLTLTSGNTNIVQVLANGMLQTFRPGQTTLAAVYQGITNSATITVENLGTLAHRYSFTTDATDSVGGANGTLVGDATIATNALQMDGTQGSYLDLPPGLIHNYAAVTLDTWATFNNTANWARLFDFCDPEANEYYFAPVTIGGADHRYSDGFTINGANYDVPPALVTNIYHITCILGDGAFELWTNGVLEVQDDPYLGSPSQAGVTYSRMGWSPYPADPGLAASVDEFRIYNGRLAPDEIVASELLGPDQTLSTKAALSATKSTGGVVLSWPLANAGFCVQASSSLSSTNWVTVTNVPSLNSSTNWQISVPTSAGPQFFRLWR